MKTAVRSITIFLLILAMIVPTAGAAGQQGKNGKGLSGHAKDLLAEAVANGDETVTMMLAATPGTNKRLVSELEGLGGIVRFRDDDVSYVRAVVPVGSAEAIAKLDSVEAAELAEIIPLEDPRPEPDGAAQIISQAPPGAGTPNANPYMPIQDIGAPDFMAANPTWDGRGVTIGIIDTGVTFDHPSLLTTSTGERKIVDWITATDPLDTGAFPDPTWVGMHDLVYGPVFSYGDVTYTAPAVQEYRIGLFNERSPFLGGELGSDVNRDGNPAGSSGIFAVLWDTDKNEIYVDTNQNNNFTDDVAMTDYKVRYDVNWFGVDNPATAVAERLPFVVQTDGKNKFVNIGIVSGAHGSHVAGIAAGNSLFGGAMSGSAPGAKIISVRACLFVQGCPNFATTEGIIYAAKQGDVDVLNMSIGGLPALNDGNTARAVVFNRLIEQYNVQFFFSAGNSGPGANTVGDPSVTTRVLSIGSYITQATWLADYGTEAPEWDNLHHYSSRGPREDGGFKPNLVASGAAVSTTPMWQPGAGLPYALPPGYSLFNGTSMASPQAAGGAALLISAAKQSGVQHQPAQIRQALMSSARFLDSPRIQAFEQGSGLVSIPSAWELLRTNIKVTEIVSSVQVNTVLSGFLKTPGFGEGIYDREGVSLGQPYTRTYTFVRTKGGSKAVVYNLSWVGNDGTFSTGVDTIALPVNKPVELVVNITPSTAGAHSAILRLDDPNTTGIDYQTLNTVFVPDEFTIDNQYTVQKDGTIGRSEVHHYFFLIPPGTPAFKVDFSGPSSSPGTGQLRFLRWHPYGVGIDSNAVSNCYAPPQTSCTTGSPNSRTVSNPMPGVWEVSVDARRSSDSDSANYTLTASILGATVSPNPDVISSATANVPVAREYTLTNMFGAFTGRAVSGGTLGSALIATPSISTGEVQEYYVEVTPGSTSLRATIGGTSDPAADLDLYVDNCTSGTCVQAGSNADGDSEESVTINNPAAGNWRVRVDGYAVPAGTTTYNYVDVFINSAFGSVSITDANALRPAGSSWTVPGSVTANAAPSGGRVLLGSVQVRTDGNVLVGSGQVIVQQVTP